MDVPGQYTQQEIFSQPEVWQAVLNTVAAQADSLDDFFRQGGFGPLVFTGSGSSYNLALSAAALYRYLSGRIAMAYPSAEVWLNPASVFPAVKNNLLIAASRSGETTELVHACMRFLEEQRGQLITLSCYRGKPLMGLGSTSLVLEEAQERSVAQTRAFSGLYLAIAGLVTLWSGRRDLFDRLAALPEIGRRLLRDYAQFATGLGRDERYTRFYFLGSGIRYGLACELSLKMKEMSISDSEPFHFLEFRHGPKAMLDERALLVALVSESGYENEMALVSEAQALGAKTLTIGERGCDVVFASGLDEVIQGALYLPVGQLLAYEHAMLRGVDPDNPRNLDMVVKW